VRAARSHPVVDDLLAAIKRCGWPMKVLAHAAGVSEATLRRWRRHAPRLDKAAAVARALGGELRFVPGGSKATNSNSK
jgi:lambda repressor-like predicted transcriptional regulator